MPQQLFFFTNLTFLLAWDPRSLDCASETSQIKAPVAGPILEPISLPKFDYRLTVRTECDHWSKNRSLTKIGFTGFIFRFHHPIAFSMGHILSRDAILFDLKKWIREVFLPSEISSFHSPVLLLLLFFATLGSV